MLLAVPSCLATCHVTHCPGTRYQSCIAGGQFVWAWQLTQHHWKPVQLQTLLRVADTLNRPSLGEWVEGCGQGEGLRMRTVAAGTFSQTTQLCGNVCRQGMVMGCVWGLW